jgi:hypothetical protein
MPDDLRPPSEAISPEFSEERLRAIGDAIAKARLDKLAKREAPDASWNLSCDCYMWAWHALGKASNGRLAEWLYVPGKHGSLDRIFYIGGPNGIPVKFYNADSPGQPLRTSRPSAAERVDPDQDDFFLTQPEPARPLDSSDSRIHTVIRIAMHMQPDLSAASASVQRLNEGGEVVYEWPIPLEPSGILPLGEVARDEGVDLPEPHVELHEDTQVREEEKKKSKERDNSKGA